MNIFKTNFSKSVTSPQNSPLKKKVRWVLFFQVNKNNTLMIRQYFCNVHIM